MKTSHLRLWLILLTVAAVSLSLAAVVLGLLVNMDTQIEMNPHGDPLVRQDALGQRWFVWGGAAVFVLLQAGGTFGGWLAFARGRLRRSMAVSLLAAIPGALCMLGGTAVAILAQ